MNVDEEEEEEGEEEVAPEDDRKDKVVGGAGAAATMVMVVVVFIYLFIESGYPFRVSKEVFYFVICVCVTRKREVWTKFLLFSYVDEKIKE